MPFPRHAASIKPIRKQHIAQGQATRCIRGNAIAYLGDVGWMKLLHVLTAVGRADMTVAHDGSLGRARSGYRATGWARVAAVSGRIALINCIGGCGVVARSRIAAMCMRRTEIVAKFVANDKRRFGNAYCGIGEDLVGAVAASAT